MKIVELGSVVTDKATGCKGMLTHLQIQMGGNMHYNFQPRGLHSETQQPLDPIWITADRIAGADPEFDIDLPTGVLGTHVEDMATGFNGTAVALTLHQNGCVHFDVQPKGQLAKTGEAVASHNFDIRRLKGASIKPMTKVERRVDQQKRPSPSPVTSYRPARP